MKENRWLFFVLGVSTVLSLGAVTNQVAPVVSPSLGLSEKGIIFPDGSMQTTAATAGTSAVPCYCRGYVAKGTKSVIGCTRADNDVSFTQIPTGQFFLVSDVILFDADLAAGSIYVSLGLELAGTIVVDDPYVDITVAGYPEQAHRSFRAPYIVLRAGQELALRNLGSSAGGAGVHISGFLVSTPTHHL